MLTSHWGWAENGVVPQGLVDDWSRELKGVDYRGKIMWGYLRKEGHVIPEAEVAVMHLQAKDCGGWFANSRASKRHPAGVRGSTTTWHSTSRHRGLRTRANKFPVFVVACYGNPSKGIQILIWIAKKRDPCGRKERKEEWNFGSRDSEGGITNIRVREVFITFKFIV